MKKMFQILAISALVLTGLVASASAQSVAESNRVKIDFPFNVGDKQLSAGEYRIKALNTDQAQKVILVQRLDGKGQAVIASVPGSNNGQLALGGVRFNKYGDKLFLASVQLGDDGVIHHMLKSRAERAAEKESPKIAGAQSKPVSVPTTGQ